MKLEGTFIAAAEKLEENGDIHAPWANSRLKHSMDEVVKVSLSEGVILLSLARLPLSAYPIFIRCTRA